MKQFIKLSSILVALSLIALTPSQAQTVTFNVVLTDQMGHRYLSAGVQVASYGGIADYTPETQPVTAIGDFTKEVVGGGSQDGISIVVAPAAVNAHLAHGDVIVRYVGKKVELLHKPVGSAPTATIEIIYSGSSVTVHVAGVTADVTVNVTGNIVIHQ